jgi:hypothetical protein
MSEANAAFLELARHGRHAEIRSQLAQLGAAERSERLRAIDEDGNSALCLSIIYDNPNAASLLLQFEETDVMHANRRDDCALSLAARSRRPFVVSAVLHRLLFVEQLDQGELVTLPMLEHFVSSSAPTGVVGKTVSLGLVRRNLVDLYAQLSLEALSLCVVRAFKRLPGTCLYECVQLAAAVQLRSRHVRGYDTFQSDDLEAASARIQLAVAGCLASLGRRQDGLGRYEVFELLQSRLGEAAVKLAIRHGCKHFLSQPPVQGLLMSEWRGPLLHSILTGSDATLLHALSRCVTMLLVLLINLGLLPLFAAFPPLEELVVGRLKRDAARKLIASQLSRLRRDAADKLEASPQTSERPTSERRSSRGGNGGGVSANGVAAPAATKRAPLPPAAQRRTRRLSWTATRPVKALEPQTAVLESEDEDHELTPRPPLLHYYLLRVPMLKFCLRLVSDVALAVCATFDEGEPSVWVFLVWPLGGLLSEYTQLIAADETTPTLVASLKNEVLSWVRSDVPSNYRADLFNTVDMLSLHLLLVSEVAYYAARSAYLPLRSFAVLALYVRLLRLIYIHPTFGALVLLLVRMTRDLVQLFVLIVFVVVALVSAMYVVEPTWTSSDALDRAARLPACDDFYILGGSWSNWAQLAFVVLNAVVDGRAQDALFMCVLHEENENRYLLWTFVFLLLLFVVVLLLNMLIAMFSRSFDLMYDSMAIHLQTHFARAVVAWCASTPEPPPLNLLQVPYTIARLLHTLLRSVSCKPSAAPSGAAASAINLTVTATPSAAEATAPAAQSAAASPSAVTTTHAYSATRLLSYTHGTFSRMGTQPEMLHPNAFGGLTGRTASRDYEGTTVESVEGVRNSWETWKESISEERLTYQVADFVAKREDTLAQEERWRTKMMRRLGDKFDHVDARLDRLCDRLEQLASSCSGVSRSLRPQPLSSEAERGERESHSAGALDQRPLCSPPPLSHPLRSPLRSPLRGRAPVT